MKDNLENLSKEYLGRGIIIGKNEDNISFVTYILTGRSDSSKARTLEFDERCGVTYTKPTDRKKLDEGSPVLLLYPSIITFNDRVIISNGAQTKLPYNYMINSLYENSSISILINSLDKSFFEYDAKLGLIDITSFEPDKPNYTPRITGCVIGGHGALTIARRTKENKLEKKYFDIFLESINEDESKLITTYDGIDTGREPLHSFTGKPLDLRLTGKTEEEISSKVREAINPQTFIAVATQFAVEGRKPYIINLHGGNK